MKLKGVNLRIVALTSVTIFSLGVLTTGTFAWFTTMRSVGNNGGNMPVTNTKSPISSIRFYTFHKQKEVAETDYFLFSKVATGGSFTSTNAEGYAELTTPIVLQKYSLLDPHHPLLMLVEFGPGTPSKFTATTESDYLADPDGGEDISSAVLPLSSVIQSFYFTFTTSNPIVSIVDNTVSYYAIKVNDCKSSNQSSFVKMSGDNFTVFDQEIDLYSGSSQSSNYTVGIVFDYYPESIEYIYSHFLGYEELDSDLNFGCDWRLAV